MSTRIKPQLPVPVVSSCDYSEGPGITHITIDNAKAEELEFAHLQVPWRFAESELQVTLPANSVVTLLW